MMTTARGEPIAGNKAGDEEAERHAEPGITLGLAAAGEAGYKPG